ncbi:erythromycin esterase family protein [Paenibacillus sp. N4]|uniref:erythromycin esterase family protein n=1 Tax=Paenibacillus vietnamensis TaxID=2590547 RepID=UPI001CD17773|nr:erythromycin esterase family protein [Paenibacillus vietnamensis]MCA0754210.1 erythromycin esterase family protein [Paenibacillus vietnamensis]
MEQSLVLQTIGMLAKPYNGPEDANELLERAGRAKYVLLGEASHGTSEYYKDRAALSKRLIADFGFRFIAVEGDWPSCYTLNRYVKGCGDTGNDVREALRDFARWPEWMWANREIVELAEWLRKYNADKPDSEKAGFYGIDVYSLWESMSEILSYLEAMPGSDLEAARRAFECFEPHGRDEQQYGISASFYGEGCEGEVVDLLRRLQDRWRQAGSDDREDALSAEMNALAVRGAEAYYRTMIRHDAESWNIRDRHMVEALEKLMQYHGETARAIVWEHNTHIGDARWTDMAEEGMVNVGQLLREKHGSDVFAVGYGTYRGTVIAGRSWGAPAQEMKVPEAITNSWEELLHRSGADNKLLLFDEETPVLDEVTLGHRAIGVVYHPERERGNYVPTVISKRYDAFLFFDQTHALSPLSIEVVHS